jgi:flavin reductase (DIM6/NTAB) family NADH-FMN oxidoreductase RutF
MNFDLSELKSPAIYHLMTQAVIPRPVAWVLSENEGGDYNLAPFSYFTPISSNPPLLMFSVGKRREGSPKDTHANIAVRKEFVVHIPHMDLAGEVTESSAPLAPGQSEVTAQQLELEPFPGSRLPRLGVCRVALACELHEIVEMGNVPQALIFGRIRQIWIEDALVDLDGEGHPIIHADRLDPLGRLGGEEYAELGEIIQRSR